MTTVFENNYDSESEYDTDDSYENYNEAKECDKLLKQMFNDENMVIGFSEKSKNASVLINAGQYIINREHFLKFKTEDKFSIELDFFQNSSINKIVYGFEFLSDFIDIGIPEDLIRAQSFFNKN